jgi:D-alanyl-D-alanine carboxypeptidase
MLTNRRGAIGLTAGMMAGALATGAESQVKPATIAIKQAGRNYTAALAKLRDYAIAELDAVGLPGMTLTVVDVDGFTATMAVGWSDIAAKIPVRSDQLFQIGSISKSITALCLHGLAEEGLVDLDAPISRYLKGVPLPEAPITLSQLLEHASGFPHNAPAFPNSPGGRLWSGFAPGSRSTYSNLGYELLGLVIDSVTGRPHREVIAERVIAPLGMTGARAHILLADEPLYAVGYMPLREDHPILSRAPIAPGPFVEVDVAAGCVAASGEAMIGYLRYVLALGRGIGKPLLSDAQAKTLLATDMENEEFPQSRYASGFATVKIDGRPVLHHTGGMTTFSSSYHADPAEGVACFASVNGRLGTYRPRVTTAYAVRLLRAIRTGVGLPEPPDPLAYRKVADPARVAGHWVGSDGRVLDLVAGPAGLTLHAGAATGRIELDSKNALATDHPEFSAHALTFESSAGPAARLWWGETLFARDIPPVQPKPDASLSAQRGLYVGATPWQRIRVLLRGNELHVEGVGRITERPGGYWSPTEDPSDAVRFWFDKRVNGQTYVLCNCGYDFTRLT